ncbi:MAG: nucleotidyltransferase domain-containing protein [Candidatus Bathyarchaeia archaeon]
MSTIIRLPEKIRRTLEKIVSELRTKENIYGVGLFGSWSRNEAALSSDIDLFILEKGSFNYEYVERTEVGGLFLDFDHVPKNWLNGPIPPELDQKLYEMQILYDRDWSLTNTKILMTKVYCSPERVNIRAESHVIDSDIYLSRATSAISRGDFQSAYLFAITAIQNILKVLLEIALEPFSNSRFLEKLERAATKLGMQKTFREYLEIAGLKELESADVNGKLKLFKMVLEEAKANITSNQQALEVTHFKVRKTLGYYLNCAFLQGTILRTTALIEQGKAGEAYNYLRSTFLDMIENYAWFKSTVEKIKADYTTLMRTLERLEERNPKNYKNIADFLELDKIDKRKAAETTERARNIIAELRMERKALIKNYLKTE